MPTVKIPSRNIQIKTSSKYNSFAGLLVSFLIFGVSAVLKEVLLITLIPIRRIHAPNLNLLYMVGKCYRNL